MFCRGGVAKDAWAQTRSPMRSRPAVLPVVADFSTSIAPEGKIRFYRNEGKTVPDGWILDADGKATNDPNAFYGPPRGGILPLGAARATRDSPSVCWSKSWAARWPGSARKTQKRSATAFALSSWTRRRFARWNEFRRLMDETVAYIKSSRPAPGFDEVLVPGELEFGTLSKRQKDGIPVDAATVEAMRKHGERLAVDVDGFLNPAGEE